MKKKSKIIVYTGVTLLLIAGSVALYIFQYKTPQWKYENIEKLFTKTGEQFKLNNYDNAILYAKKTIVLIDSLGKPYYKKKLCLAYSYWGKALMNQKKWSEALTIMNKGKTIAENIYKEQDPVMGIYNMDLGIIMWNFKKYDQAERYFKKALLFSPHSIKTQKLKIEIGQMLGNCLWKQNKLSDSIKAFKESQVSLLFLLKNQYDSDENIDLLLTLNSNIAQCYCENKQFSDAANLYKDFLKLQKYKNKNKFSWCIFWTAVAAKEMHDSKLLQERADFGLRVTANLAPSREKEKLLLYFHSFLGYACLFKDDLPKALNEFLKAKDIGLKITPQYEKILEIDKKIKIIRKCLISIPNNPHSSVYQGESGVFYLRFQ